jgi:uncharacterized protein YqjF (DUF2071 family)
MMVRSMIDRLAPRRRPSGCPFLRQRWSRLVFLHWRVAPDVVRAFVPATLDLDLFEGAAWVSVVPLSVTGMRPAILPPIPRLGDTQQVNVRTYVHRDGVPGLWFFSIDADNPLAVWGARIAYRLAFFHAHMNVGDHDGGTAFSSERTDASAVKATFEAQWRLADELPVPEPGTLDFFLLERYVLYSGSDQHMWRSRIHHRPWPLRSLDLRHLASTMVEAHGLPRPTEAPLTHAQALPFEVAIWAPRRVARPA